MPIQPDGSKDCVTNSKAPRLPADTMLGLTPGGASPAPTKDSLRFGARDGVRRDTRNRLGPEVGDGIMRGTGDGLARESGDKISPVAQALADHSRREVARDRVTAIVPARNEEQVIATCVRGLARQPEISEILVVDDQSSDGTAGVVRGLTAELAGV